jgi:hypothetical protein
MLGTYFHHSIIRKSVIAFGNLFNNIDIRRLNSNSEVVQQVKVPIFYAPKEKYLVRIAEDKEGVAVQLPLLSYEISGLTFAADRQRNVTQKIVKAETNHIEARYSFDRIAYDIGMSMSIFSRHTMDGTQILEQILPYFAPKFSVPITIIPELDIVEDVHIILNSVSPAEEYESGQDPAQKKFIWNLDFTIQTGFYGPVKQTGVIKKSIATVYSNVQSLNNVSANAVDSPTSSNLSNAISRVVIQTNPISANSSQDFGFSNSYYSVGEVNNVSIIQGI